MFGSPLFCNPCDKGYFVTLKYCDGELQGNNAWLIDGVFDDNYGISNNLGDQEATSDASILIAPDHPVAVELNCRFEGHAVAFPHCPGETEIQDFDWYRVVRVDRGYNYACCKVEFYDLQLERIKKPCLSKSLTIPQLC